jgi:nitroreductase/NAD-dependent dihydropyrimidine dehydrogenase PreA subunit
MPWDDVKQVFRPETVHMGVMQIDPEKCTRPRGSDCQLCYENCPFRAWEAPVPGEPPHLKAEYECFSCYNCMVACPRGAVSITEPYHVDEGFWKTEPHVLPARLPLEPLDANGSPDQWNAIERAVYNRRSVRNFRDKPVPEHLIRRVLEAGRFAPSAGNCQPWRFIVVTNKALIQEMDEAIWAGINMVFQMYKNEDLVKQLAAGYEMAPQQPGTWDPRLAIGGMGSISRKNGPALLAAPAVILILGDERAIAGPEINAGICGQNMNLVCNSLGIKSCWVGFASVVNQVPPIKEKLGIEYPWRIITSLVLGYPRFKQEGVVPREYRPVTWFREDRDGPEIEE